MPFLDDLKPGMRKTAGECPIFTPRVLAGIETCGYLHLGNYLGALKQHIALQHEYPGESYYLLANYHALTSSQDGGQVREESWNLVLDYLALGVDPVKSAFYRQSDVPQICELLWILACLIPHADLAKVRQFQRDEHLGGPVSAGKLLYPALMAADILGVRATIVPIGEDQLEHIGIVQETARRFNATFECQVFPEPAARLNEASLVLGLDGRAMHRINRNIIPLFAPEQEIARRIMMIQPSGNPPTERTSGTEDPLLHWFQLIEGCQAADVWRPAVADPVSHQEALRGFCKTLMCHLEPFRQRRMELERDFDSLEDMLRDGARRVREQVSETVGTVREMVGIGPYRRSLRS